MRQDQLVESDRITSGWIQYRIGEFQLEIDWDVAAGDVLVLFGPSGSGKTTTLRAIAGLVTPQSGRIQIGSRIVFDSSSGINLPPHHRRVGYLTQQYNLFPHLTVEGNIGYGLPKRKNEDSRQRVRDLINRLELGGLTDRHLWELSGGQQQRVALARALAPGPEILLLDEPFAALDAELRRSLRQELRNLLTDSRVPIILVTHDREEALALGDQVQVIDRGQRLEQGLPLPVLGQPGQGRVARLVGVENMLPLRVEERHPQDGTMICRNASGLQLEVPLSDFPEGSLVTVGIRASDIILATEEPSGSSARNHLRGRVSSIQLRPPGYQVVLEYLDSHLQCHITGRSLEEMNITEDMELWAIFKASSCFLVAAE